MSGITASSRGVAPLAALLLSACAADGASEARPSSARESPLVIRADPGGPSPGHLLALRTQQRPLAREVDRRWDAAARELARNAAALPFEDARSYAEVSMSAEIAARVAHDLRALDPGITVCQVHAVRPLVPGAYRTATYGTGTWLLGPGARAELDEELVEVERHETRSPERAQLEQRIRRYLENRRLAGHALRTDGVDDADDFWTRLSSTRRAEWILAAYAEHSGDWWDVRVELDGCSGCEGSGALLTGGGGGGGNVLLDPCPTCRTIGVVRTIRYR